MSWQPQGMCFLPRWLPVTSNGETRLPQLLQRMFSKIDQVRRSMMLRMNKWLILAARHLNRKLTGRQNAAWTSSPPTPSYPMLIPWWNERTRSEKMNGRSLSGRECIARNLRVAHLYRPSTSKVRPIPPSVQHVIKRYAQFAETRLMEWQSVPKIPTSKWQTISHQ